MTKSFGMEESEIFGNISELAVLTDFKTLKLISFYKMASVS